MSVEEIRVGIEPQELLDGSLGAHEQAAPAGERRIVLPPGSLARGASLLSARRARFVTIHLAGAEPGTLVAAFAHRGEIVSLRAPLSALERNYPSLTQVTPAALLDERELHDRHGLRPEGHDGLEPALRPDPDRLPRTVSGPETFVIPYGPIRSGIFESIQFVVETGGEDVLRLGVRPFFKRRALEQRFEGLSLAHSGILAERVAGIASVAHAVAFCGAVERALGVAVPRRADLWRAVHAELERIANHLDVAAKLADDAALSVGVARFTILKEDVLRFRAALCGSRFGRGVVVPGGIASEPSLALEEISAWLHSFERELARDRSLLLRTASFTDRLIGSGRLDRETMERMAGVGPVARASGVSTDARFERPYGAYSRLGFDVVVADGGDAMARLEVRFGELGESLHLIRQALDGLTRAGGDLQVRLPGASGAAFGWAEAPQGELVYWVEVEQAAVARVRIASPSLRNWPLFAESFRGDVLTDFSFIEHSFGLTAAGADR